MGIPIISEVIDLIGGAIDKIWPDANTREKAKDQMKALVLSQAMEEQKLLFADTEGARELFKVELEAQKAPALARFFQVMARPFVMYACCSMYIWNKIAPFFGFGLFELNQWDYTLIGTIFVFLFGARSFEKIKGKA